jgi:hypothetical protein
MINLTLDQLRAMVEGGAVLSVTLEATGADFSVKVETRKGDAILVLTNQPNKSRTFADPRKALLLLRELGIRKASVDATRWQPEQRAIK